MKGKKIYKMVNFNNIMKEAKMRRVLSNKAGMVLLSFIIVLSLFSSISLVFSLDNSQNSSSVDIQVTLCLNESKQIMNNMINDNFSVLRINDSLRQIYSLYGAQMVLKEEKSKYDFSVVIPYCDELKNISTMAYGSRDSYEALKKFYLEYVTSDMNTSSIDLIMDNIKSEIKNERYENVKPLVDKGYLEIINVKTSSTTLNLFYRSTTRGIKDFFLENWLIIVIVILVILVLFFIYKKTIYRWMIKRKISALERRKNTLKELIMKTQKDYFEKGLISDGNYTSRTKKFAELIRDIERQVPLLKEDLIRAGGKVNSDKEDNKLKNKKK
jgi:hypothetical protein